MKLIIPSMMLLKSTPHLSSIMPILTMLMMIVIIKTSSLNMIMLNFISSMDILSLTMINLTMLSVTLIIMSAFKMKIPFFMLTMIMIILNMAFSTHNMMTFYIMFEMVLIPTLILILMMGVQPERLQAGIYFMIYTITASLPLLISIINMKYNSNMITPSILSLKISMPFMFLLAFLVKLPMFMTHLWLPKAHVEAPMEGSMILAAVLLKLGGYGIIRFMPMMMFKINFMSPWLISISMIGAAMTSMNCIRQKDLKSLIAYSSVAHMGLILASIMTMSKIGLQGAVIMMVAHGLSSSALFMLVTMVYTKLHTRNIISFKGLMMLTPNITFWWFMFTMINISAPPSINLLSEIMMMMSIMSWNMITTPFLMLTSMMTAVFSISLFINITHNNNNNNKLMMNSETKYFMSLMIHLIPLILLSMKPEFLI